MPTIYTVYKNTDREFSGNQKQICEHFGITYSVFSKQLKNGMSPDEAIEYCILSK